MAKLSSNKKTAEAAEAEVKVAEQTTETPAEETPAAPTLEVDTTIQTPPTNDLTEDEGDVTEDEAPAEQESNIEVNTTIDEKKMPEEMTKVRLRVDHSCCIAMEFYNFKAGQMYHVTKNVKRILNEAGLLAPL